MLGLHCFVWASAHCGGFSRCGAPGSRRTGFSSRGLHALESGSVLVAHRFSRFVACGILPDQRSDTCPLRWKDSYPLHHWGGPSGSYLNILFQLAFFGTTLTAERRQPSHYRQVEAEVRVPHLISTVTSGGTLFTYRWRSWEFWLPSQHPLAPWEGSAPLLPANAERPGTPAGLLCHYTGR